jgi:glutaredoxin
MRSLFARWRRRALLGCLAVSFAAAAPGCKSRPDDAAPSNSTPQKSLAPLTLTDDTPDLMLTWISARGDANTVGKPADVPTEGRDQVRVVVTTKEDGARDLFYVTNLTVKNPDGSYPVTTMPREEWEAIIIKRRQAFAAPSAPTDEPSTEPPAAGAQAPAAKPGATPLTVIVYGASWCGACHQAVAYLKSHKVPVIEKDIEADPAADTEMRNKLARAGVHGGSIPVIDVKGKILIGFEPHQLEAAVRGAGGVAL